ncbi:MAG: hypothetical protein JAY75_16325 [Candidatus Thiodiazotropha taylori]|nr:hypothetical protein [Candidatus Thiodiazotropha taylori]MCW4309782.1 hypothetical protein [Candidatus Thiodiazotropha endolucinida]
MDFEAILRASDVTLPAVSRSETTATLSTAQNAVSETLSTLQPVSGQNIESLRCTGDEIFAHVPKSLRQQISKGEYINLALLLKGGMELKEFCSGGSLKLNAEGGIEMKAKVCRDKITSIEKWTLRCLSDILVHLFTAIP